MIINFNNRQQTFSSCLWTLSFKNLACLYTSYLKMTLAIDIQAHHRHADQANTIFPSLPSRSFVYILFRTLKSGFLYMILLCLLVSSNLH